MALDGRAPRWTRISSATTTQVKEGAGTLKGLIFTKPVASSTVTLIDGTSGTTANIGIVTNTTDVKPYFLDLAGLQFFSGLRIVTSGADDVIVVYS